MTTRREIQALIACDNALETAIRYSQPLNEKLQEAILRAYERIHNARLDAEEIATEEEALRG